jgi:hypothetical protein
MRDWLRMEPSKSSIALFNVVSAFRPFWFFTKNPVNHLSDFAVKN